MKAKKKFNYLIDACFELLSCSSNVPVDTKKHLRAPIVYSTNNTPRCNKQRQLLVHFSNFEQYKKNSNLETNYHKEWNSSVGEGAC